MNKKILNLRNIDLFSLLKDLVRSWWIILMVSAMGVMISHAYISASYVPEYTQHRYLRCYSKAEYRICIYK